MAATHNSGYESRLTHLPVSLSRYQLIVITAFAFLVLGSLAVRLATFERYLPYLDYQDESHMYVFTRAWSNAEPNDFMLERLAGYPPLYIVLHDAVQRLYETLVQRPWYLPSDYIYALRLLAVGAGVLTTIFVASIGWQVGGWLAGWFAGAFWAFAPIVVDNNSLAIADPIVYVTCAAAVTFALQAWRRESLWWLLASLAAGILAVYAKYWTIYTLLPWAVAAVKIFRAKPRQSVTGLVLQLIAAGLAAGLLLNYINSGGLSRLSPEMTAFTDEGIANVFNLSRYRNNLSYIAIPIGHMVFLAGIAGAIPAYIYSARRGWRVIHLQKVLVLAATTLLAVALTNSFIYISSTKYIRHALPVAILFMGIWGAALAQVVWTLVDIGARFSSLRFLRTVAGAGALTIALSLIMTSVAALQQLRQQYALQPTKQLLWMWSDANIPNDGRVLMRRNGVLGDTWNRPWSGYDGTKPFEWWFVRDDEALNTPAEYVERGITYFAVTPDERAEWFSTPERQDFINQLTHVKTIANTPETTGETIDFYRMLPPENETAVTFGEQIKLVGYDLNAMTISPGDVIQFRPYWRIVQPPATNYSMFIHIYPQGEQSRVIAQHDGAPTSPQRLTLTWTDPDELYIGADAHLTIPQGTPPGGYVMAVGLYDFTTGQRLLTADGSDVFTMTLTIEAHDD